MKYLASGLKAMTEEEFFAHYAKGSNLTVEELRALGGQAVPCDCGMPSCRGWKMKTQKARDEEKKP